MGDFDIPIMPAVYTDDRIPSGWVLSCWKCEYCGESQNVDFIDVRCRSCAFRRGPDDVWRVIGKLGPRADGRTYYIWGKNSTGEIHYTWDKWFWYGSHDWGHASFAEMGKMWGDAMRNFGEKMNAFALGIAQGMENHGQA